MSLWPRNKPLNQPPHAGRIGAQHEHPARNTAADKARSIHQGAQFDREHHTRKNGLRAVVR